MAVYQLDDGRWIVHYRKGTNPEDPNRRREYFGRGTTAETAARARNRELGLGRRRAKSKPTGPTFEELALTYSEEKDFSENSRKHLDIRLEANLLPFFGALVATAITPDDVTTYVKQRRNQGVKNATISRELTDLKAILNWSVKRKPPLIPFNPIHDFEKPKPEPVDIIPPSPEETRKILAAASDHLVRFIRLSYYLGLRPGAVELLSLDWDDVLWDKDTIRVRSAEKGGIPIRWVPIHEDFRNELKSWWKTDKKTGPIIHYHGRPIKKIQTAWAGALKRAGITRRIRPYDLRHDFITDALEQGADIGAVADVVGSSPETLRRSYQHVTNRHRRQIVNTRNALIDNTGNT